MYSFATDKQSKYHIFKFAVQLIESKEHLTKEGLRKLVSIKYALDEKLSEKLIKAFPGVVSWPLASGLDNSGTKNRDWLAGYQKGEALLADSLEKARSQSANPKHLQKYGGWKSMVHSFPYPESKPLDSEFVPEPIIRYANVNTQKSKLISENKDKAGIYRWTHK